MTCLQEQMQLFYFDDIEDIKKVDNCKYEILQIPSECNSGIIGIYFAFNEGPLLNKDICKIIDECNIRRLSLSSEELVILAKEFNHQLSEILEKSFFYISTMGNSEEVYCSHVSTTEPINLDTEEIRELILVVEGGEMLINKNGVIITKREVAYDNE